MSAEMTAGTALELAKTMGGCWEASERSHMACCERAREMQTLKGGRWHPWRWQLLNLLLWHSHCCCVVCCLCVSLRLWGRGGTGLSSCSVSATSCTQSSLAASDHHFVVGHSKGVTGLVPRWARVVSAGDRAASMQRRRKRRQGLTCLGRQRCEGFSKHLVKLMKVKNDLCNFAKDIVGDSSITVDGIWNEQKA